MDDGIIWIGRKARLASGKGQFNLPLYRNQNETRILSEWEKLTKTSPSQELHHVAAFKYGKLDE
jgi:hypothetical protein